MPDNVAVWLSAKRAPFIIGPAIYTEPLAGEIVIRVRAVAVNPMDRAVQNVGDLITPWVRYPFIPGSDVAGDVVAVGEGVSRFRVGNRVFGYAAGSDKGHRAAEGGFQRYVILQAHMACPLPEAMSFEGGAVLPLGVSTAASALFERDCLALEPLSPASRATGKTLLVWGGSTSVGSNAIQLAVAAGYEVIATASPHNFDYVRRLGAREAFDYRSKSVVTDIVKTLRARTVAGALAIGAGSAAKCLDIVAACQGVRFVAMTTPPASFDHVPAGKARLLTLVPTMARMGVGFTALAINAHRKGVRTKFVWGSALLNTEVGPMIFDDFLPSALAEKRFVAAPEPLVVGHGLDQIAAALDRQLEGVSARKLVVTL